VAPGPASLYIYYSIDARGDNCANYNSFNHFFHYNVIRNSRLAGASVTLYHHAVVEDARAHNFIRHVAYSESACRLRLPHGGFFLVLFVRLLIRFLRVKA